MSYQVLARKWRPGSFAEMVGQEHVLQALINALDNNRLHHAYLFTGTRGVGKTTIARILAKALNCKQGVSSKPCGECGSCREIAEGRFVDLIEVDAASRTRVEDTRELLDNVQYAPTAGRFKVYLIDEVHMLSSHSFNALLKTLEEPPPHIKFLLATTDPQKLPVTILSRCLQFNLKNISPERIVHHLQYILEQEQVPFEENGLWPLARAADGSMRDALSLTDQAIAHGGGQLNETEVNAMLGTVDLSMVLDICNAVAGGDSGGMLARVAAMADHSPDYGAALAEILSIWHRVAIAQTAPDALDNSHGDYRAVVDLANSLPREDVQLFYQIGLLGRRDLNLAPDPRTGFEMALLRMISFKPVGGSAEVAPPPAVTSASETGPAPSLQTAEADIVAPGEYQPAKKPEPAAVARAGPGTASGAMPANAATANGPADLQMEGEPSAKTEHVAEAEPEMPAASALGDALAACEAEMAVGVELQPASPVAEVQEQSQDMKPVAKFPLEHLVPDTWIDFYQGLPFGGVIKNTAANLVLLERRKNHLRFQLDTEQSSLYEVGHQQRLAEELSGYFGSPVTVEIEVAQVATETPQANRARLQQERLKAAVASMQQDPIVNRLIETFDAALLEETVRPVDGE